MATFYTQKKAFVDKIPQQKPIRFYYFHIDAAQDACAPT